MLETFTELTYFFFPVRYICFRNYVSFWVTDIRRPVIFRTWFTKMFTEVKEALTCMQVASSWVLWGRTLSLKSSDVFFLWRTSPFIALLSYSSNMKVNIFAKVQWHFFLENQSGFLIVWPSLPVISKWKLSRNFSEIFFGEPFLYCSGLLFQ